MRWKLGGQSNLWPRTSPTEIGLPTILCNYSPKSSILGSPLTYASPISQNDDKLNQEALYQGSVKSTSLCTTFIAIFLWGHWAYSKPTSPCQVNKKESCSEEEASIVFIAFSWGHRSPEILCLRGSLEKLSSVSQGNHCLLYKYASRKSMAKAHHGNRDLLHASNGCLKD